MTSITASKVFKAAKYEPHAAQRTFHASHARNRVVGAGRRLGKSEMGAGELDIECAKTRLMLTYLEDKGHRREFWIVGPNYTDSEKEFRKHYNALKRMGAPMDKPGTYYDAHSGDMQLSMYQGKYLVLGKSAAHPERLVGEGLSGVIMAEAAKQRERTWTKYIRPTLADFKGWSIHTSTPEGKNWFYDLYMRGQDPNDDEWASWRFGAWRNPFVYPGGAVAKDLVRLRKALDERRRLTKSFLSTLRIDSEIISLMRDQSSETFNQETAALFTEFAGRVFKDFDDEYHVRDLEYNPALPTYAASDYGFTNPFVWLLLQVDHHGTVYVIDEIYETGLTIDDAARMIQSRRLDNVLEFYPDPARPEDTLALERHLQIVGNRSTGGALDTRLRYIREALKDMNTHLEDGDPLRHPKLLIDRSCVNTIREMNDYRYPETSKESNRNPKDQPLDKDNHCPEALGRFYRGRYGDPNIQAAGGGARVARSNLSG
jgi:hypothetical protein